MNSDARKILITGSVGSGKSTFARALAESTGLPLYELDTIAHPIPKSDYARPRDDQRSVLERIDRKGQWILEGSDRKYQRYLFDWADLVIFMDTPLSLRKRRIATRFLKQILGLEKCGYRPTLKMLKKMFHWTKSFEEGREEFVSFLSQFKPKVHHIKRSSTLSSQE